MGHNVVFYILYSLLRQCHPRVLCLCKRPSLAEEVNKTNWSFWQSSTTRRSIKKLETKLIELTKIPRECTFIGRYDAFAKMKKSKNSRIKLHVIYEVSWTICGENFSFFVFQRNLLKGKLEFWCRSRIT